MAEVLSQSEPGGQPASAVQDKSQGLTSAYVTRLAMIDVTWAHWGITPTASQEQRSSSRHQSLLDILLRKPLTDTSGASKRDSPPAQPSAWISLDPQEDELNHKTDLLRDRISADPLLVRPREWFESKKKDFEDERRQNRKDAVTPSVFVPVDRAQNTIRFIIEGLEQCELIANRAELRKVPGLLAAQMNLFACRVYLTPASASGLIHGPLGKKLAARGHVLIDLRFREHLGRYWLYATFSVGTHQPSIPSYWPPSEAVNDRGDDSSLVDILKELRDRDSLEELRDRYTRALQRGFRDHVHALLPRRTGDDPGSEISAAPVLGGDGPRSHCDWCCLAERPRGRAAGPARHVIVCARLGHDRPGNRRHQRPGARVSPVHVQCPVGA